MEAIDLTGQKFGRLTVLYFDKNKSMLKNRKYWVCQCSCEKHTIKSIRQDALGKRCNSCGCLQKEIVANYCKNNYSKTNTYDLSGEYGIGYTLKGEEFYFDLEDYDKIKGYCWHINEDGYIVARDKEKENDIISLHRLIMDCPDNMVVDHIHGKNTRNDNRKSNLRICTQQNNSMNRGIQNNNTSGVTGVSWDKSKNKWMTQIKANNKNYIKRFNNFDDAYLQRKKWEEEFFGEFSYDNSIKTENNNE